MNSLSMRSTTRPRRGRVRPACLMTAMFIAAAPADAQLPERDTTEVIPIAGVTVTVLRTPFELARLPYSVSVNGEREVRRAKPGLALDEAMRGIPGVQVDNRYNYALGERISIRGSGARAQFGVRGVRVLVDGVPATFADGQTSLSHVDMGTLRRVEVIRGPASALYGNTAGGVIQLETAGPPRVGSVQELGVTTGANGLLRVHGAAGGAAGPAGYRLDLSRLEYGGHREYGSAENLRFTGRLDIAVGGDELAVTASAVDYDARNPGSLSRELLEEDRSQAYAFNRTQGTGEEGRQGQLGARWRRETGAGALEVAGYAISRSVANPIPNAIIDLDRLAGGVRGLYRGSSGGADPRVRWTVGADADLQRDDRLNHENEGGARGGLTLDQHERVTNLAGFAQLSVEPARRLAVLGGVRYDWFRFTADDHLVGTGDPDDSGRRTMDAVSPSVGVSYEIGQPLTLYANVATSFETPTTTELANRPDGAGGFSQELRPQEALSYELGARGSVSRRVAYQAAAYRTRVRNALIPFQVPDVPGRDFYRNAGSAVHRGVEIGVTLAPISDLRLDAAYTHIDARFDRYAVGDEVHDGNRVPGIAPHRVDVIAAYDAPGGWFLAAEHRYVSEMHVDDANAFTSPGYGVVEVRGGLEKLRLGRLTVRPFVGLSNVFDVEYNTSVTVNAFGGRYYEPGPGRAVYGGATLRLGGGG